MAIDSEMAHVIMFSMGESMKEQGNTHPFLSPEMHELARQRVVRLINHDAPGVIDSYPAIDPRTMTGA